MSTLLALSPTDTPRLYSTPLQVYIVKRSSDVTDETAALSRWFRFHDISAQVCNYDTDTLNVSGWTLIISEDLYPSPQLVSAIVKRLQVCSTITLHPNRDGTWRPSFLLLCNFTKPASTTVDVLLITAIEQYQLEHRTDITTDRIDPQGEVYHINAEMADEHTPKSRFDLLFRAFVQYWYAIDNLVSARYYAHAWINAYQRMSCESLDLDGLPSKEMSDLYDTMSKQSPFASSYKMKVLEGTLQGAVEMALRSKVPLGARLHGVVVRVKEHPSRLYRHPLTLSGLVRVEPVSTEHNYDTRITMVGFYYELGYASKPKEDYLASLDKYLTIRHPLVFYGSGEICNYVRERRDPLYTVVVDKPVEEWQLVKDNLALFNDTRGAEQMAKSPRYALLTNCKTYAVVESIERNPFNSEVFVWHDPGFYRHGYMAAHLELGVPLFSKLEIEKGKITIPSLTTVAQTSDEQYDNAVETLIAYIMGGDRDAWRDLHLECARFLETKIRQDKLYTEQCVHTRIATLRPDLFRLGFSNYAPLNVNRFIGEEVNYDEIEGAGPTIVVVDNDSKDDEGQGNQEGAVVDVVR